MADKPLSEIVADADQASLELHASMLNFDMQLGLLKRAIDERGLAEYERSVWQIVDSFSVRHDRMGAL